MGKAGPRRLLDTILDVNKIYVRLQVKMLTIQPNRTERQGPPSIWASRESLVVSESEVTGALLSVKGILRRLNHSTCAISCKRSIGEKKERK